MGYETDEMILFGYEEKQRFLNELLLKFGKDASLECVLQNFSQEKALPIKKCKFTGLLVYNLGGFEMAGDNIEFTGTIKEILEECGFDLSDEEIDEETITELVEMFCNNSGWTESIGSNAEHNVRCVPMDRPVTKEEVKKYLTKLAEKE